MNKEMVVKLLSECLPSTDSIVNSEKYQALIDLLENVKKDTNFIIRLDVDGLNEVCHIDEDEKQEIEFYKLVCDLDEPSFKLTYDQVVRINELIDKYLVIIHQELKLINKSSEKNDYLRKIIEKIKRDSFVLNYDELNFINEILKEGQIELLKINEIIVMLSLLVIQNLEKQLNTINYKKEDITTGKTEVMKTEKVVEKRVKLIEKNSSKNEEKEISNDRILNDEEFRLELKNILEKFGYLKIYDDLVIRLEELRKNTSLDEIAKVLETIRGFNVDANNRILIELVINSSKKVIDNVINIYKRLSGMDDKQCFKFLYFHVSIFMKDGDNSSYQDFIKNMCMLDELGVSEDDFALIDVEILCMSHNRLKKNILTLEKYHISRKEYLKSITVLKSGKNISDELDTWIELGNSEAWSYLRNRLAVLVNNTISNFKNKLRILRDLDINITINDNYKSIKKDLFRELDFISETGIVRLEGIDYEVRYVPYVVNNSKYDELMNKRLLEFQEDIAIKDDIYQKFVNNTECVRDLYYVIPGVGRISKNKVHRVFNNLLNNGMNNSREMLIYAITYKSAITEEEYNIVCSYVDNLLGNTLNYKGSGR